MEKKVQGWIIVTRAVAEAETGTVQFGMDGIGASTLRNKFRGTSELVIESALRLKWVERVQHGWGHPCYIELAVKGDSRFGWKVPFRGINSTVPRAADA